MFKNKIVTNNNKNIQFNIQYIFCKGKITHGYYADDLFRCFNSLLQFSACSLTWFSFWLLVPLLVRFVCAGEIYNF